mmetsp:Transcript_4315/g.4976  ORF Transcript_4315/g.4976 Transcript_4315/m.4976 type:complete len:221 (-) Transcript_4315:447-1109(-)
MMCRYSGILIVPSAIALNRVVFPTPFLPTRPYLTPLVSCKTPLEMSSSRPPYSCTCRMQMSMFAVARMAASGPVRMKKPRSSAVLRIFMPAFLAASASSFAFLRSAAAFSCSIFFSINLDLGLVFFTFFSALSASSSSPPSCSAASSSAAAAASAACFDGPGGSTRPAAFASIILFTFWKHSITLLPSTSPAIFAHLSFSEGTHPFGNSLIALSRARVSS